MRNKFTISIIGDSVLSESHINYLRAIELGKKLIDNDFYIIHGGRGGIMEAITIGAKQSSKYHEGCVIGILPGLDINDKNNYLDIAIPTGLDVMRNAIVVNTDAVIAIGGGAGTLSEIALAWTMNKLIIAYKGEGWSGKLAGTKLDNKKRLNYKDDKIFSVVNADDAINICKELIPIYKGKRKLISDNL
ncbi:MAG: hypothetical protein Kow0068_15490 [Marinilabiliales bacterium]